MRERAHSSVKSVTCLCNLVCKHENEKGENGASCAAPQKNLERFLFSPMSRCLCVSLLVILVKNKATHAHSYVSMAACWVQLWHDYSTVISIDIVAQQCLPLLLPG